MTNEEHLDREGFLLLENLVAEVECEEILAALSHRSEGRAGTRRLLEQPWCRALAERLKASAPLASLLAPDSIPLQCTLFDKSTTTNWKVPFHQDLSLPLARRQELAGWSGWSEKEGMLFAQPPSEILDRVLAIRLHLDRSDVENGPLRVVPRSHRRGRLTAETVERLRQENGEIPCTTGRGGAVLMRPLLLHASSKSTSGAPRRVLHFLFVDSAHWPGFEANS